MNIIYTCVQVTCMYLTVWKVCDDDSNGIQDSHGSGERESVCVCMRLWWQVREMATATYRGAVLFSSSLTKASRSSGWMAPSVVSITPYWQQQKERHSLPQLC